MGLGGLERHGVERHGMELGPVELTAAPHRPVAEMNGARRMASAALLTAFAVVSTLTGGVLGHASGGVKEDPALVAAAERAGTAQMAVIVREARPASSGAEALIRRMGGRVTHELPIIGSFSDHEEHAWHVKVRQIAAEGPWTLHVYAVCWRRMP